MSTLLEMAEEEIRRREQAYVEEHLYNFKCLLSHTLGIWPGTAEALDVWIDGLHFRFSERSYAPLGGILQVERPCSAPVFGVMRIRKCKRSAWVDVKDIVDLPGILKRKHTCEGHWTDHDMMGWH